MNREAIRRDLEADGLIREGIGCEPKGEWSVIRIGAQP
jgi:hypothetical protein